MLRLPLSLERRLRELLPSQRDRDQFVADVLEEAIAREEEMGSSSAPKLERDLPESVGGTLHLFTDGGSRGNPGQAAIGCILEDPSRGVTLEEYSQSIGIETNNVAEYRALIEGLRLAQRYQPNRLICHLDSELIVRQLNGEYRVKMATMEELYKEVKELVQSFADVIFRHIPRRDNYRADALVNKALDAHSPRSTPVRGYGLR